LKANTSAVKHPVNVASRDETLAKLVAEFNPTTTFAIATCKHLAAVYERLSTEKAGSTNYTRLITSAHQLQAALCATQPVVPTVRDTDGLSLDQLAQRAVDLAVEARRIADKEAARLLPDPVPSVAPPGLHVAPAPEPEEPPPPDQCPYCHQTPCIGPTHHGYSTLHFMDPLEIEKRDKEATAVMLKMMPFKNPY
jgi:hypothetical protein